MRVAEWGFRIVAEDETEVMVLKLGLAKDHIRSDWIRRGNEPGDSELPPFTRIVPRLLC